MPRHANLPKLTKAAMALSGIEAAMSRREIAYALQLNDDPMIRQVGDMLTDHGWRNSSLAVICKNTGIGWAKIACAIKDVKKGEGEIRMAMHLPQIMEDTARDALSVEEACLKCETTGQVTTETKSKEDGKEVIHRETKICGFCFGRGRIRRSGDNNARKLVFETASLTGKTSPVIDNRSMNINLGDGLEDTLKALRKVRDVPRVAEHAESPILDATVEGE